MDPHPELAIEASSLVKVFGRTRAVDGLDLAVPRGTVYGFLGPNGAGKTTAIRILATLLRPDGGSARVLGYDVEREADRVRQRVSLTGQFASVDEDLTGLENLVLLARLWGHSRRQARARASELLDAFDLSDVAGRQVKTYSGGLRRRLDIAASTIVTPELLFLDEPTTGLDPRSRNQVWRTVRSLADAGTTVLLTTQYLDEADQLADRIAVIDSGKVVAEGTTAELKRSVGSGSLKVRLLHSEQQSQAMSMLSDFLDAKVHADPDNVGLRARVSQPEHVTEALTQLSRSAIAIGDFSFGRPSLDEVFLALTGHAVTGSTATSREDAI